MAVLVVGAALEGSFSFAALTAVLVERLGPWAEPMVPIGLLAAGLSSAVTAPLAAALTARGLWGSTSGWNRTGWRYRLVWLGVLGVGVGFGVSGAQPVPVIVLAQALNGALLPLVAIFLLLAVNDRRRMGDRAVNGALANLLTTGVVAIALVLGLNGMAKAAARISGVEPLSEPRLLALATVVLAVLALPVGFGVWRARRP